MTKKDLLEAIEDMPMDAKIRIEGCCYDGTPFSEIAEEIAYVKTFNEIKLLC